MIGKYFTVRQVCEEILVGADPLRIQKLCREGKMPGAVRIAHEWRIPEEGLKQLLKVTGGNNA